MLDRMSEYGEKHQFGIDGKKIVVYPSFAADRPVVYLNTYSEEGDQVYEALRDMSCPEFTLVAISGLNWDHDMAPWDIPPISENDTPCTGGADDYLRLLLHEIVPKAEEQVRGCPLWRGISGYSLGGLFAVYALYQTGIFERAASMSGSLWFPGFAEYIFSHEMVQKPKHLYFSLGDAECRTKNPYLKVVKEQTEKIERFYRYSGIDTCFSLNPGNHYQDGVLRTAAGIAWLLER